MLCLSQIVARRSSLAGEACKEVTGVTRGNERRWGAACDGEGVGTEEGRVVGKVDSFRKFRHPCRESDGSISLQTTVLLPKIFIRESTSNFRMLSARQRAEGYDWLQL